MLSLRRVRPGAPKLAHVSRASALGSWPGTDTADVREAIRVVRDTLTDASLTGRPGIPYLPEAPRRGPGADLIGRAAALLVGLSVDLQPSGWRLVDRPGRDESRAAAYLRSDLDELAEAYDGYAGPLKVQLAGPWTLAAELRLNRGERVVVDRGACRDVAAALAEGVGAHLADVRRLVPGAELLVQLDEPLLPAVLAGELATSSGFGRLRAVDVEEVRRVLAQTIGSTGVDVVVHCCAADAPVGLLREAGASGISLDTALLGPRGWEAVAVAVEAGTQLWAGALPTGAPAVTPAAAAAPVLRAWRELGLDQGLLEAVVITPACGLAGSAPADAVRIHRTLPRAAAELTEAAHA